MNQNKTTYQIPQGKKEHEPTPTRAQRRAANRAYVKKISKEIFRLRKHNLSQPKPITNDSGN
jgi:hypothetical protein